VQSPRFLLAAALVLVLAGGVGADSIVLEDGRVLDADEAWYEGEVVRYRKDGRLFDLPRRAVSRVEPSGPEPILVDPDVRKSRDRLATGDTTEALRFARLALFRDPTSVPGLEALAAAQLALGDAGRARASAETALTHQPHRPRSLELLGDALLALGDVDGARHRYRAALEISEEGLVRGKLEALGTGRPHLLNPRFRISYDGTADEPLGLAVLGVLDGAWNEYESQLGFSPDLPVTVVLQTASAFRDTTRAPEWAAAVNDGTILVPVRGIQRVTPDLERVLRHELAHSFLAPRVGGTAPTWLQEGLAQWLEGGDPAREDRRLAAVARRGQLLRLEDLEPPFAKLTEAEATSAYAQSLSAVAHLLRLRGAAGLRALVAALARGQATDDALQTAFGLDYAGLQRGWEAHLSSSTATSATATGGR
jgi:tetratricopeptide (TPR) repeat protein